MALSVDAWGFARALLVLAARKETCCVHAYSERGTCRLRIQAGALIAVTGPTGHDDSLGDVLLRSGDLDAHKHYAALAQRNDTNAKPVGAWLLAEQLATRGAVLHALRAQLRGRMLSLLGCQQLSYAQAVADHGAPSPELEEPPLLADVLLGCLRALSGAQRALSARAGELELSALGRALLMQATLWPEEEPPPRSVAGRAARFDRCAVPHPSARLRAARVARELGGFAGAAHAKNERGSYGLLLRKRNQIRQGESPYRLLDLPVGATPYEARKALRQFALQLHPDALGPGVPDALRRASGEVMGALIDAERSLRLRA